MMLPLSVSCAINSGSVTIIDCGSVVCRTVSQCMLPHGEAQAVDCGHEDCPHLQDFSQPHSQRAQILLSILCVW